MKIVSTTTNSNGAHIIDAISEEGLEYIFILKDGSLISYRRLFDVPFKTSQPCESITEAKEMIINY